MKRAVPVLAVLALLLSACDSGAPEPGDADPDAESTIATCAAGIWRADVADLAAQLGDYLIGNGIPVLSSTATGDQELSIDAGTGSYTGLNTLLQFAVAADLGNGLTLTLTQSHHGVEVSGFEWVSDSVIRFTDIVEDEPYQTNTAVDINGTDADYPIDIPIAGLSDVPLTVTCEGDVMTTKAEQSPFTTTWNRY